MKHWNEPPHARSLSKMTEIAKSTKIREGVKSLTLLRVPLQNVIPCELHMRMHIGDVLLRNLVLDAQDKDNEFKFNKIKSSHIQDLGQLLWDCGVSFEMWHDRDPITGKQAEKLEYSQLSGSDYKILYQKSC